MAKDEGVIIGSGEHRYRFVRDWARLPRGWLFRDANPKAQPPRIVSKGAVAANGEVFVLSRSAHPVTIFDPDGNFITSWGEGQFSSFVHGLTIAPSGNIWIVDSGWHVVTEHAPTGEVLRTIGDREFPAPTFYGQPFNMPTAIGFAASGDFYVSDGYGNRRVHRFTADGTLKHSWGEAGNGPGQFAIVHFVALDAEGRVYITDRDNHRIQIFSPDGDFQAEWNEFLMPSDLAFGRDHIYVGGQDGLSIWTLDRKPVIRWARNDPYPEAFHIHGIWLDAEENIYLAQFDHMVSKLTRLK
jgi:DNA-binding beta-propeller fold protein YncE